MQLYIGNKNYSSWSMRALGADAQAGIAFEEVMVRFDCVEADSPFKNAAGLAPDRPGAGAGRRRLRGLGHAGDRRVPGRELSRQAALAGRRARRGPGRAACAPRCTRASARCAATAR